MFRVILIKDGDIMLRLILKCAKCKKEFAAFDENESVLEIDFETRHMKFNCIGCGHVNIIQLGRDTESKLPSMMGARF